MSTPELRIHLLPTLADPAIFAGCVAVVIDNLRASVTIAAALASGAQCVVPVGTVDEALSTRERLARERPDQPAPLLGGERRGLLIPGFDLDNSPDSYSPQRVAGRVVVFTTTNGTLAIRHASRAAAVYVGSLANLSVLCDRLRADPRPVHVLCAGTGGRITLDDCIPAGAIARSLRDAGHAADDAGELCIAAWESARHALARSMAHTAGGRNLVTLGLAPDVERCAQIDVFPVLPRLDGWRLVREDAGGR